MKDIPHQAEKALIEGKQILASKQDALLQLGQIQAFNFVGKLVTVTELKLVQQIKESKSYKGLTYSTENGELVTVTTWEDCCTHILKTNCQNLDNRLRNLQQFGEEFFEAAQQMKLGYRDLRALRQLPEEEQALVIESEAVETGDKDAVKELIDELKAKHKKEKSHVEQALDATERMLKASRTSAAEKDNKIIELQAQLESSKFSTEKWKGETKQFFAALHKAQNQVLEGFTQLLVLNEQLETLPLDERAHEAASSALYADSKILLTRLAGAWNELHRCHGHLDDAKPSAVWLEEMGFEAAEVIE
ncbi:MAG: hypothetical protein CMK64_11305 [Pseudoalteromonas sp.]|nr:hypothetical protein [Pseudoalteromonas sp.]|tara:strand:+ start:416 stop:1330 length:915 start_codon:yes stop_codon:yes gene_type:complete